MTTVKFKTILKLSKKVKKYVKKHYQLPKTLTVDNIEFTYMQMGYLFAKAIQNPGKDVELIKVKKAKNNTGEKVKLKLTKKEYTKLAKNLTEFIEDEKHRRLPNYLTSHSKKIKQRVFIYSFAKILVYYNKHAKLSSTCKFKTSETVKKTFKKYGHATKHGCDNMGQNNSHNCGPHSVQECIRNLTGKVIPQSKIASWAGTTTSGTDHQGLETAVAKAAAYLGVKLEVKWVNFSDLGWNGINKIIKSKNQDCLIHNLYRDKWGHYETVNSIGDNIVKVQNSLGSKCAKGCYCGYVENRSAATFKSYINGISQKSVMIITRVD